MGNIIKSIDNLIEKPFIGKSDLFLSTLASLVQDREEIENVHFNDFLFCSENDKNIQRFISICFIRILGNENSRHLEKSKHQVLKLIQNSLPDICNNLGITDKTETYNKETILKDFINKKEKELDENICFNGELSSINGFNQTYRRITSARKNILEPFVDKLLSKPTLDKIFIKLHDYTEAKEDEKYPIYCSVNEIIEQQIESANAIGTKYAVNYIAIPFNQIKSSISNDIEKSPFYIPVNLSINKTEKKYPLSKGVIYSFNLSINKEGKGYAQNVNVKILGYNCQDIKIYKDEQYIGNIKSPRVVIEFEYEVLKQTESIVLEVQITWSSADKHIKCFYDIIELSSQSTTLKWEEIINLEPYNLEPVETVPELIGRDSILNRLRSMTTSSIGSSYVYGQRRVGKTSIVKTLLNSITNTHLLVYYIEAGDWNDAQSAFNSMNNLGEKICRKIQRFNPKFNSICIPNFHGSFNKITDFLDEVIEIDNNFKVLIILDEFDRISRDLYERGDIGQSFVLTIRAISNKPQFGFILVGGEKLEYILSQWLEFNKFKPIRVDYFSKEEDWEDFKKLIQKPVENILEISDNAIQAIYEETAGNPYFTKMICIELFNLMINNRDIHVTDKEAKRAATIARSSSNIGATDFSHFWEDGITGKIENEAETSLKRRKLLIVITDILRKNNKVTKNGVYDLGSEVGLSGNDIDKYLREFEQRRILQTTGTEYSFVVNFFKDWLSFGGVDKIVSTFEEEEKVAINKQREDKERIKPEEILDLTHKMRIYKGQEVTSDKIRQWLDQFDDVFDQRLMFKLLQNFKLYTEIEIREKMETLFSLVKKEIRKRDKYNVIDSHKKKREDILVTYLDSSPAKGGSYFAKLFANANNIYSGNASEPNLIEKRIRELRNLNAILIIDDFIGSGNNVIESIDIFFTPEFCILIKERKLVVVFGIITGYSEAKEKIEKKISELYIDSTVLIIDLLNESDKCFSDVSTVYTLPIDKKKAKEICKKKGELLEPKYPLGYFDCQSLIAFPMNCPNNTLPVFWKKTEQWIPLFER